MEIRRRLDRDGTLGPRALDYLAEIPEKYLFSPQQQLRHPAAIYNVSLEKVTKAFVAVLEGYARETDHLKIASNGKFEIKSLLDSQEHLLRCLQEHMDDCC